MGTIPVFGFLKTLGLLLLGRVELHREDVGRILTMEDGRRFRVFRHVEVRAGRRGDPRAVFIVRFTPARMTVEQNVRFSRLPMMALIGFRGFRSKYWCVDDEMGMCQGVYQWQTMTDAVRYSQSVAMRFMTGRSVPGSVTMRIVDQYREKYWVFSEGGEGAGESSGAGSRSKGK